MMLQIGAFARWDKKQDCHFGRRIDYPNREITACLLLAWVKVLSNEYVGTWGTTRRGVFTNFLHIGIKRGDTETPMFLLRYDDKFRTISLRMDNACKLEELADPQSTRVHFPGFENYVARCDYLMEAPKKYGARHPYTLLGDRLQKNLDDDSADIAAVRVLMDTDLAGQFAAIQNDAGRRNDFCRALALVTKGDVETVIVPDKRSEKMESVDGGYLYRLTCIFPWAIDLLYKHPKCAEADTTFEAVRPYTLACLHAIFANESMPLGFAISPSEVADAYMGLYNTLLRHLARVPLVPPDPPPPGSRGEPLVIPPSDGKGEWFDEPIVPVKVDEEEDWCEFDDEEPPVDTGSPAGEPPATTGAPPLAPETEEEETEEEDWGEDSPESTLPRRPPPERPPRYYDLQESVPADVWERWRLLLDLPILTDQGTALRAFVDNFGLIWKLCHRHIIESMGAKSCFGRWAARLLRCFSPRQWRRTCHVIQREMIGRKFNEEDPAYKSLMRLLGRLQDRHPLSDIRRWACWWRLGCPRTTNSTESVNGHLNAEIKKGESFPERVSSVALHFMKRYQSRNVWRDRAFKRNEAKCYPNPETNPLYSEAEMVFYQHLHDAYGKTPEVRKRETFLREDPTRFFPAQYHVRITDKVTLPTKWEITEGTRKSKVPAAESAAPPDSLRLHANSAHTKLSQKAWEIAWDFLKQIGPEKWKRFGQEINFGINAIATNMEIPEDRVTAKKEAAWRRKCDEAFPQWISPRRPKQSSRP
jgi:hypothetical protein